MEITSRKILGEFMTSFPRCLNPFEIQTRFKLDLLLNFIIQNLGSFGSWAKKKIVPFEFISDNAKFRNLWSSGSSSFILCKLFESFEYLEICLDIELGPTLYDRLAHLNNIEPGYIGNVPRPTTKEILHRTCWALKPTAPRPSSSGQN
jgi:hypothetical protein